MPKLKAGMMVNVFEDPYTQTKLEGRAKLIQKTEASDEVMNHWLVEFPDARVPRFILPNEKTLEVLG